MILEFVGLPGAGKTTFTRALCTTKRFTRVRITSVAELLWYNFLFTLRFPVTTLRLFAWLVRYRGPRTLWYTKFTSIFLDYNAKYMKARRTPFAVLDQGHLQFFMSLFEDPLQDSARRRLLDLVPKADHYVFFDIAEATRLTQLDTRGYTSRPGLMSDSERIRWQDTAKEHFAWLTSMIKRLAPATADTVVGTTNLESWVERYRKVHFIRYVTFARLPTEKAHGLQIATMCNEFQRLGHFVALITPKRRNPITATVTDYYQLETDVAHHELAMPDVIGSTTHVTQLHHYLHEVLFALGVWWTKLPKGAVIYTRIPMIAKVAALLRHRVIAEQHYWPSRGQWLTAWLLRKASLLIANSEGTKSAMADYGLRAVVAHNGFPKKWLEVDLNQGEAKQRLGIVTELPIVMYVGSLGDWKGVDTLCGAAQFLKGKATVVVIGGSESEVRIWKQHHPEVIFTGGRPYADLGWIQKASDILVVPNNPHTPASERYTSPIKLFAHLASGRPVLVSDLPTMRAIVDERSVWFFNPGDTDDLYKNLLNILSADSDTIATKLTFARNLATNYTWESRAHTISNMFKNL